MTETKKVCPCCFSLTLNERGRFEICEVCYWEDDGQDDKDADTVRGGPNQMLSLTDGRESYRRCRASNILDSNRVRRPRSDELTERSILSIVPPTSGDEPRQYSLRNINDGSVIETVDLLCPASALEPYLRWRR